MMNATAWSSEKDSLFIGGKTFVLLRARAFNSFGGKNLLSFRARTSSVRWHARTKQPR
jgi:hypothetical protein